MNFLEYYNLSNAEKKSTSLDVGSLSNSKRLHRHEKSSYGLNQILGKTKNVNGVAKYLINKDDDINQCIRTGQDVFINPARAKELQKYGTPTPEEPEKAIKQTGVYIVLCPNNRYKLTFKGKQYGKGKIFR